MTNLSQKSIGNLVDAVKINDSKFKSNIIAVSFLLPIDQKESVVNSLVSHILLNGSEDCSSFKELHKKLDSLYSASIYSSVTKLGDKQLIEIFVSCIKNEYALNNEDISLECAKLLKNLIFHPIMKDGYFLEKYVEKEKQQMIEDVMSQFGDKRSYAIKRATEILFENEKMGVDINGPIEKIQSIKDEELVASWKKILSTSKVQITLVGDMNEEKIFKLFTDELANIDRKPVELQCVKLSKAKDEVREINEKFEVNQSKLVVGFKTDIAEPSDKTIALMLGIYIFGGTPNSKLFTNVREKMSLCYYCQAVFSRRSGCVLVDSGVENKNVDKAKNEILNQLDEMKKGNITDDEINATKLNLCNSFTSVGDSHFSIFHWYLYQMLDKNILSVDEMCEKIMSITKNEIIEAINTLKLDTIYLISPKEDLEVEKC